MKPKTILILLAVIIVIVALALGYSSIKKTAKEPQNNQNNQPTNEERSDDMTIYLKANNHTFTANLVENTATKLLLEKLSAGDITIHMQDYANFEKVGELGFSLPASDEQIRTTPGDLILYEQNKFVVYYDTNSWNFTRLGKIENATKEELLRVLGEHDVVLTLSLTK